MKTKLPFWKKMIYGSGDWGLASLSMMRSIFYAIFMTDVVGLEPRLASIGALVGIAWDALNDPLVGMITDRVHSRWGRRRPFLLFFAIPFALSNVLLWTAPAWESQVALTVYVTLAFMLSDTMSTLISVPFLSLTPEMTRDYDERTSLTGFRTLFQLVASLTIVVAAPMIVDAALTAGFNQQQGFLMVASLFGTLGSIPFIVIFFVVRETSDAEETQTLPIGQTLRTAWENIPFRFAALMHMLNWSAVDMVAVVFPFFLLYYVAGGNLLAKVNFFGLELALESAFFGTLMFACIITLPLWLWLSRHRNKREAYIWGLTFWIAVEVFIITVQPGQMSWLLVFAALAGVGVSSAYVLPDSIFPDIIEWDELRTRRRQEGIYYGARSFIRKLAGGFTIFFALQVLGWAGYQSPAEGVTQLSQPLSALWAIRLMISLAGPLLLFGALSAAWFYPLSRERHARIVRLLARRKEKAPLTGD